MDTFHGHGVRLLLMSTRTGGVGLNLACASRVILYDAEWNPAHDAQVVVPVPPPPPPPPCARAPALALLRSRRRVSCCAIAQAVCRAYRYGQPRPVFIYRLVAEGIEECMYRQQVRRLFPCRFGAGRSR